MSPFNVALASCPSDNARAWLRATYWRKQIKAEELAAKMTPEELDAARAAFVYFQMAKREDRAGARR